MARQISCSLFGTRQDRKNESGMVLVVATTFILAMSLVVIGILSRNVSQGLSADTQFKKIQAEQLARGAWWQAYGALSTGASIPSNYTITQHGVTYSINFSVGTAGTGPNNTTPVLININY